MDEANPAYNKIMNYIEHNPAAVLSTLGEDGAPHGAVVYVCTASHHTLCFVTKNQTKKYFNITKQPKVSLTFYDERESSTLQATGRAFVADDTQMVNYVLDKITKMHAIQAFWKPPVTKIHDGEYVVVGVELDSARLAEYQGMDTGSGGVFTQI